MSEPPRSLLITGGAGFIGSSLVRLFLAETNRLVINLDKLTYAGHRESLAEVLEHPRHHFVEGDIGDAALVAELLEAYRPDTVFHLAAESHVDRSIEHPPQFAVTNAVGTCSLLNSATQYWQQLEGESKSRFRFTNVSTDEVFGSADQGKAFDEKSPLKPNSPYAASKAAGEHFAHAFAYTYGLPVVTVNPSNNYGPRQHPEKLIPKMILCAAAGEKLPLYGDGRHERDWLHVDDCCRALFDVWRCGDQGRRYLVGEGEPLPNRTVVEMICDLVDEMLADGGRRKSLISSVPDRPGHDRRYAVDSSALRELADWKPRVSFSDGLRETVRWYLDNPAWVATVAANSHEA